ncbi:MAG: ABC transporter ATP-binding protein [Acholeplasmatales bacterium]|nr:ABC transporter ATP-binding protein [Acholeplasmatales bacterium]
MEIIKINDLSKDYKDVRALNNVNLAIEEGMLYGLLGVNGAGKTTLIKILSGLTSKTSGDASIKGFNLSQMDEIKKIVDISPQESAVALNLTVKENLIFFQEIYDKKDKEYLEFIINSLGLKEVMNRRAKTLSGGYQRRLSIAIGLVSKPEILFLDEPTLGLDVISRRELWKIIEYFKGKVTIILTSHYLEEIEALCDKVAIMSKGNVLCEGTVEEIKNIANEDSFEEAFVKIVGGQDEKDINIY